MKIKNILFLLTLFQSFSFGIYAAEGFDFSIEMTTEKAMDILGLEDNATDVDFKTAYRTKAMLLHPDKVKPKDEHGNDKPVEQIQYAIKKATEKFQELESAKRYLEENFYDKGLEPKRIIEVKASRDIDHPWRRHCEEDEREKERKKEREKKETRTRYSTVKFQKDNFRKTFEKNINSEFKEMNNIFLYGNDSERKEIISFFFEECIRLDLCNLPTDLTQDAFYEIRDRLKTKSLLFLSSYTYAHFLMQNIFFELNNKDSYSEDIHLLLTLQDTNLFWMIFNNKLREFSNDFENRDQRIMTNSNYRSSFSDLITFFGGPVRFARQVSQAEKELVNTELNKLQNKTKEYNFNPDLYPFNVRDDGNRNTYEPDYNFANDCVKRGKILKVLKRYYGSDGGIRNNATTSFMYFMTNIVFPVVGLAALWSSSYVPGSAKISATVGVSLAMLKKAKSVHYEPRPFVDMGNMLLTGAGFAIGGYCLSKCLSNR